MVYTIYTGKCGLRTLNLTANSEKILMNLWYKQYVLTCVLLFLGIFLGPNVTSQYRSS